MARWWRRRPEPEQTGIGRYLRDRVVVQTRDRRTFRGYLDHADEHGIALDHAEAIDHVPGPEGPTTGVTSLGTVFVPAANIAAAQVLAPPTMDSPLRALPDPVEPGVNGADVVVPIAAGAVAP